MVRILGGTDDSDVTYLAPDVSPNDLAPAYTPVNTTTESSPRNHWAKHLPELPSTGRGELEQPIYGAPHPLGPVLSHYKTDLEPKYDETNGDHQLLGNLSTIPSTGSGSKETRDSSIFGNYVTGWSPSPVTQPMYSRPASSGLKATSTRTRARTTPRHQHHQYLDSLLRSKCPKDRLHALNVAIQFRDEHGVDELIPNDLLDELLKPTRDDKYVCFCCPRPRKARTITLARDHVRKSLGNFPFQCPNLWCRHSSLRQADLNKHMKTCVNTAASQ